MAIPLGPGEKAHMYALGGVMRGGVGRAGYVGGQAMISIDGDQVGFDRDDPGVGVLLESLTITDILDETPNTAALRINGAVPPENAEIVITLGSRNRLDRLFAGYCLTVRQRYAARRPVNIQADIDAVDYTWLLGFQKVTKQYRNLSAGAIVVDLVQTYAGANGFTAHAVDPTLPVLDEITFTDEDLPIAITRTLRRAGGYWYADYLKDVHAFLEDIGSGAPVPLTPGHRSLAEFTRQGDGTQVLTRVYVEGRGARLLAAVAAGDTVIPVETADVFEAAPDVFLKVSFAGSAGGAMHLDFTGVVPGGQGTLVGPGQSPSAGPTLKGTADGSVNPGAHSYAFTWATAAGETRPSPIASITTGPLPSPYYAMGIVHQDYPVDPKTAHAWKPGDIVEWAYSWNLEQNNILPQYQTPLSAISAIQAIPSSYTTGFQNPPGSCAQSFGLQVWFSSDPSVKWISVWHRVNGGPWYMWLTPSIQNQPGLVSQWYYSWWDKPANYSQAATPSTVAPTLSTVGVDGIATGPASVTGRKLYRTKANQAALLLVTTIPNNTATTYTDAAADATLGAAAPVGDTSGIQQPAGNINAGATTIIVASTGPFAASGGWARIAGQLAVRYTGVGAGALTGVPPSGPGSLTGPVAYNTPIEAAPMLTGIPATGERSISRQLSEGDEVYTVVQADDPARQAALAESLHVPSGVRADWIADRRLSVTEARARGRATLALRPIEATTVQYSCRDALTASGKTIQVDLPAPTNVQGEFKIQSVTIHNFRPYPAQAPTYTVQASSARFSFEDLLNRFRTKEQS